MSQPRGSRHRSAKAGNQTRHPGWQLVLPAVVRRWIQCTQLYSASCQALHRRSNELLHASNRSRRSKLGLVEERRESSSMRLLVGPIQTTTVHEIRAWWCYKMPVVIEWHPWECTLGSSSSLPTLERSWSTNPRGTDLQPADQCGGPWAAPSRGEHLIIKNR